MTGCGYMPLCSPRDRTGTGFISGGESFVVNTVHLFWSGQLTAEVVEVTSHRAVSYLLAVHQAHVQTGQARPLFALKSDGLHDLHAILTPALSLIEHLLDGGSAITWCEHAGCTGILFPTEGSPSPVPAPDQA